jgi:hypothetical protein
LNYNKITSTRGEKQGAKASKKNDLKWHLKRLVWKPRSVSPIPSSQFMQSMGHESMKGLMLQIATVVINLRSAGFK